jgi:hypothetical protein
MGQDAAQQLLLPNAVGALEGVPLGERSNRGGRKGSPESDLGDQSVLGAAAATRLFPIEGRLQVGGAHRENSVINDFFVDGARRGAAGW